ncbi:hypothetical protein BDZ97DRAFT_1228822 [Flammula alnicola]|nr:hypothetical protein BDZ97DRAFT_1228822 [Flammula alnicola]
MTMKSYTLNNWDGKFAKPVENTAQTTQTHPNGSTRLDLDAQPETSSNYDKNPLIDAQGTGRNVSKEIIHGWRENLTDDTLNEVRPLIDPENDRRTITPAKEPLLLTVIIILLSSPSYRQFLLHRLERRLVKLWGLDGRKFGITTRQKKYSI